MNKIPFLLFSALSVSSPFVNAYDFKDVPKPYAIPVHDLKKMPIDALYVYRSGSYLFFASEDGRYVIAGRAFDTLKNQYIYEISQIDDSKSKQQKLINFEKLAIDPSEFDPMYIGNGPQKVTLFLDPYCPACHSLLTQIMNLSESIKSHYTFMIVLTNVVDQDSFEVSRRLRCLYSQSPSQAVITLLEKDYDNLPDADNLCGLEAMHKTGFFLKMFGFPGVPFLVSDTGINHFGKIDNLETLLQQWGVQ